MRVLIILPPLPPASGNQVTARRYAGHLQQRGHAVRLVTTGADEPGDLGVQAAAFSPDLVHLLHAYQTGGPWLVTGLPHPFVVTLTGTDIHSDLRSSDRGRVIRRVLERAAAVMTQNRLTEAELKRTQPELASRMRFLPPGIVLGDAPYPLRQRLELPPGEPLFLHPAGIRPVKGNLELLEFLDPLAACHTFTAAFCGPLLDEAYGRRFLQALDLRHWARYLGVIPPSAMPAALKDADIVLNNSVSEGLPNALVEAAALGRPIVARDIPGNAAVVEHGRNGLLYGDSASFHRHIASLLDGDYRRRLAHPDPELYRPEREGEALLAIYREALAART